MAGHSLGTSVLPCEMPPRVRNRRSRSSGSFPRRGLGMLTRNRTFCIVKCRLASEIRAADVLTPAPGQGEGWGGGRNLVGALPAFDPHPSLSCRPRRAAGSTRRQACRVHRTHARPAAAPARGKEHLPLATTFTICRAAIRFSANNGPRQGPGRLSRNKAFRIVKWCRAFEVRAADVLTPAPGQGEGWGGGRN